MIIKIDPVKQQEVMNVARGSMTLSFAQLMSGLVAEQWITIEEGDSWLTGTLPAPVVSIIETLPVEHQFAAKARAIRPTSVVRLDPLVNALGSAQNKTPEDLDEFFLKYSSI